ncbi:hypothetical protein EYF80_041723 [Liparis tanakae]|uniref:Uncharacterized protein n=1 Tax=Liparis tanakae TaxID=230148 RepID=A0A4Z2G3J4_9TELE|nr:hypothetical protein EYF80_041723 [Liparis tanakae]
MGWYLEQMGGFASPAILYLGTPHGVRRAYGYPRVLKGHEVSTILKVYLFSSPLLESNSLASRPAIRHRKKTPSQTAARAKPPPPRAHL